MCGASRCARANELVRQHRDLSVHSMPKIAVLVIAAVVAVGCAAPPPASYSAVNTTTPRTSSSHEFRKDYEIGIAKTATVGEAIIAVKDYYVRSEEAQKVLTPSNDFRVFLSIDLTLSRPMMSAQGGASIPVAAEATIEGKHYYMMEREQHLGNHMSVAGI